MPKFVTIGYGDQAGYDRTPGTVLDVAHAHDDILRRGGAVIGIAGGPVQVRNTEGLQIQTTSGSFMSSSLPIAGFAIIEATDLDAAVAMMASTPCAVAHGVVEVWPLEQPA